MKDINNIINNMGKEELDMVIREQDNETLKTLVKAVEQQQRVSEAQDKLISTMQETLMIIAEIVKDNKNKNDAKFTVMDEHLANLEESLAGVLTGKEVELKMRTKKQDF